MTRQRKGKFQPGLVVTNRAPHAWIFENGTQARHYLSVKGNGITRHPTGAMPPGHVFIPIAIRRRRVMYDQLRSLLIQHGFDVRGEVA